MVTSIKFSGSDFQNKSINATGQPVSAEESILTEEGTIKSYHDFNAGQKEFLDTFVRQQVQFGSPFGRKLASFFLKPHLDKFLRKLNTFSHFQTLPYNIKMAAYRNPKVLQKPALSPAEEVFSHFIHGKAAIPLKMNGQLTLNSALRHNHPFIFQRALQSLKYDAPKEELKMLNQRDVHSYTAFNTAILTGHIPEAVALLKEGADPFIPDNQGVSALDNLSKQGDIETLEKLLNATDSKLKITHADNIKQLTNEAKENKEKIDSLTKQNKHLSPSECQEMFENIIESDVEEPLAEHNKIMSLIALLNTKNVDINKDTENDSTPLNTAARFHPNLVNALILAGADVNKSDGLKSTPIAAAAHKNNVNIIKILISAGANVNPSDDSPLCWAATWNHVDTVKTLLQAGADINQIGAYNQTALCWAAMRDHTATFELLLKAGADPNMLGKGKMPRLPLTGAAMNGHINIVKALIKAGADFNKKDGKGQTPLQVALMFDQDEIVQILRENGATY